MYGPQPVFQFVSGLAGLLPQHPRIYMAAWRNREELEAQLKLRAAEENVEN